MKACGVIVEYNPFHNGHRYHVEQARKQSEADVIIAVMSGNFLQRGEPAIHDKWLRAQAALENGVDLVIELPVQWSLQSADYFARGGITLLQALGCESYCFGTDASEVFDYQAFGDFVANNQERINQTFHELQDPTLTYAQKMTEVFRQLYPALQLNSEQPNHILALSYAQENARFSKPMRPIAIERQGASYHSTELQQHIASATAIRKAVLAKEDISQVAPLASQQALLDYQVTWDAFWPLLKYQIIASSVDELREIYQMVEGLEYRLKQFIYQADSFATFVDQVKTKRYTKTRIQRLMCYLLLNITTQEVQAAWEDNALHVLGFTTKGQQYLKEQKGTLSLPLVAKIGKPEEQRYALNVKADRIYQMGNRQINEQNFGKIPIRLTDK